MIPFGYLEGDEGTILLQFDRLPGDPGADPSLRLAAGQPPELIRGGTRHVLSDARPDLVARLRHAREVHAVELDGPEIVRCYTLTLALSGSD
jgi:hypothetical protein